MPLQDPRICRAKIYKHLDKKNQDIKVSHLLEVLTPKRKRNRINDNKNHNIAVKYKLWATSGNVRSVSKNVIICIGF